MIDGTYNVEADTPIGKKSGTVALRTQGDTVLGEIDMPIVGKQNVEAEKGEGDTFSAQGVFKALLVGKVNYSLQGQVENDELHVSIVSSKGDFELKGTRA